MKSWVPTFGSQMERTTHAAGPGAAELTPVDALKLVDWRRSVFELYGEIRASEEPEAVWRVVAPGTRAAHANASPVARVRVATR